MNLQELTKAKDEGKLISFVFNGDQEKAKAILQKIESVWPDVVWNDRGQKPTDLSWIEGWIQGTISINYKLKNRIMRGIGDKQDDITLTAQEFLAMTTHNIPANTQWIGEPFQFEGEWYREVKPSLGWWYEGELLKSDHPLQEDANKEKQFVASDGKIFVTGCTWHRIAIPHPAPEMTEKEKQIRTLDSFARDFDEWLGKHEKIMQIVDECPMCHGTGYEAEKCCNGMDCTCGGDLVLSDRECVDCDGVGYVVSKGVRV